MKGSVQVYKNFGLSNQELICQEDNLLVDGAAENICTLLTMPSSVAEAVPKLLDSSNFTIQAISFGKGSNAYKENAHFFSFICILLGRRFSITRKILSVCFKCENRFKSPRCFFTE